MPTIQIRNMPQDLYDKLKKSADSSWRSLTQESIVLLEEALAVPDSGLDREQRKKVLDEIAKNRVFCKEVGCYQLIHYIVP